MHRGAKHVSKHHTHLTAIYQSVIVCERDVHHGSWRDGTARQHDRALRDVVHSKDGTLHPHYDEMME